MQRVDGERWRVMPRRFIWRGDKLVAVDAPIHQALGTGDQIMLTNAPGNVDLELEYLSL